MTRLGPVASLILLGSLLAACAIRSAAESPAQPEPAVASTSADGIAGKPGQVNPWSDFTRDLLAAHCGRCHRRDLPTAVPGALAVFDLLDEPWYGRLRDEQFDMILERVRPIEGLPPADLATVRSFVGCARGGTCVPDLPSGR